MIAAEPRSSDYFWAAEFLSGGVHGKTACLQKTLSSSELGCDIGFERALMDWMPPGGMPPTYDSMH
jgi:hypothetical protein